MSAAEQARDYPARKEYAGYSPEQTAALINAVSEASNPSDRCEKMPPWDTLNAAQQLLYRLTAYWGARGAPDPMGVAFTHSDMLREPNPQWEAECLANGWCSDYVRKNGFPRSLRDLEKMYLPPAVPNSLLICTRCPLMCEAYETGGAGHSEPLWFDLLKITSKCVPDISVELSDGHATYSIAELNHRLDRIKSEGLRPATCAHIGEHSTLCKGCKFCGLIKSPIALGFQHEPKMREVAHAN